MTHTEIEGLLVIEPQVFSDERGYFFESYTQRELEKYIGPVDFVQDNESRSVRGVVRGLHFQLPPFTQAKLVRCVEGRILDVAVDLRKDSTTYGKYLAFELSGANKRQLFIPRGFAHGFAVLSETAVFAYKCDNYYAPEADSGIFLFDPQLNIDWQTPHDKAVLSEKDKHRQLLADFDSPF